MTSKSAPIQQHTDKYTLFGALDPDTGEIIPVSLDDLTGGIAVIQYVWDTTLLQWVKMQQPTINADDLTITMGDVERLLAGNYWNDQRFEFSGDDLIYKGLNTTHKALTSDTDWYILKYTWDGSGNPTRIEGPLVGSWDNRASLAWA